MTADEIMECIEAWSSGAWGDRFGEVVRICMDVAKKAEVAWIDEDTITRHMLAAKDCPPDSQVMLVSSLRRLRPQQLSEAEETIWQLTRALREAVESPTFMGEPVLSPPPA